MIRRYEQYGDSNTVLKSWLIIKTTSKVISIWNLDLRIFSVYFDLRIFSVYFDLRIFSVYFDLRIFSVYFVK